MVRSIIQLGVVIAPLVLGVATAAAHPHQIDVLSRPPTDKTTLTGKQYLWLNRCGSGCTITSGTDDAMNNVSSIAGPGTWTVQQSDKMDDTQWASFLVCMQQVYSPYAVTVSDQPPPTGQGYEYNEEIVAGSPADIGYDAPSGVEGVAIVAPNCTPLSNTMTYSFLDAQATDDEGDIVLSTCWTAAQESAHLYGLDHEYVFTDGTSACDDPMTYRDDCGGEKFFRDKQAKCGEFGPPTDNSPRPGCGLSDECGGLQNSHQKLLGVLGAGTPTTTPPVVSVLDPHMNDSITNSTEIFAAAGAQRGVATVDLYLNGYKWSTLPGAAFGDSGQMNPSSYSFPLPAGVPDGVIDIQINAADDLGIATMSAVVTVTKGAPCTDASTCDKGQMCSAGKCFWNAPAGALGDACTYPQFCTSGECEGTSSTNQFCTVDCTPGLAGACDTGYDCVASSDTAGFCLPQQSSGGGCCSVGGSGDGLGAIGSYAGLAGLVLVLLARRRARA